MLPNQELFTALKRKINVDGDQRAVAIQQKLSKIDWSIAFQFVFTVGVRQHF
jgi:hypothetical protein